MDSRQINRAGIPELKAAFSQQVSIYGGRRDLTQDETMNDSFQRQIYGSVISSSNLMYFDHQSLPTTNYDPEADQSMSIGSNHINSVFDEHPQPSMLDKFEDEDYKKALQEALTNQTETSLFSTFIEEEKTQVSYGSGPSQHFHHPHNQFVKLHWHCGKFVRSETIVGGIPQKASVGGLEQTKIDQKIQAQIAKRCCISKYYFKKCLSGSTKENPAGSNPERWVCRYCNTTICTRCLQGSLLMQKEIVDQDLDQDPNRVHIERIRHGFRNFYTTCKMQTPFHDYDIQHLLLDQQYELVAIGNTNVGKSSLINQVLGGHYLLNTSEMRETSFIWRIIYQNQERESQLARNYQQRITTADDLFTFKEDEIAKLSDYALQIVRKDIDGKILEPERTPFNTKDELVQGIRQFSALQVANKNKDDVNSIERIELVMPISENLILQKKNITVVDMPGIEDRICLRKMMLYIEATRYKILPMFVIDLTQGTIDLVQFKNMKKLFRSMKNFRIPFVFTKFRNFIQDVQTKMQTDGDDIEDQELVVANIQKGLTHFRESISKAFNNPAFFLYDPNEDTFFVNDRMEISVDDSCLDNPEANYYRMDSQVIEKVREHIRKQFSESFYVEQVKAKVSFLHNQILKSFNELKTKILKETNNEAVMEQEYKMAEEMQKTQKEHFKKVILMVLTAMPSFLKQAMSADQNSIQRGVTASSQQQRAMQRLSSFEDPKATKTKLPDKFQFLVYLIDKFIDGNLSKYRLYNMTISRRFIQRRVSQILADLVVTWVQKVPAEAYLEQKQMQQAGASVDAILDNFINKYIWVPHLQDNAKKTIKDQLKERQLKDKDNILTESFHNIEKRQEMYQKKDESVIYKELMYRQINVNIIKEVLSFFEEHSFGEDYYMSLEDGDDETKSPAAVDEIERNGSSDGGVKQTTGAHSSQGNASTGDDGSIRCSK